MFEEEQKTLEEQAEVSAPEEAEKKQEIEEKAEETEDNTEEPQNPAFFAQEIVLTEEEKEKRELKKTAKVIGFSFLLMSLIILSFSFIAVGILNAIGFDYNETYNLLNEPAVSQVQQIFFSIIIFTVPFILVCKISKYRISDLISFKKPKKEYFLPLFLIGMGICAFANIATSVAGSIFENFGVDYNVNYGEDPKGIFGLMLSVLATIIVPALVEEFACRGIVLGMLRKFGDTFAIIASAVMFGLMHSNFEQIPFAFLVGLGLGFITVKSGSIWLAVLVHACNNSVSILYSYFLSNLSLNFQNISYTILLNLELILGIISFLFIKDSDFFKLQDSKTQNGLKVKSKAFFLSVPIIIYTVFCIISSLQFFG